jgi:hypothetical protein
LQARFEFGEESHEKFNPRAGLAGTIELKNALTTDGHR